APWPVASVGWTRARAAPSGGRSGDRPVAVLSDQDGREHLDRPLVEGPVVDDHLYGWAREPPHPLGRRGGTDDDVHSPQQATQRGPLGGAGPDERDVWQAGVGDRVLQVMGVLDGGGGHAHPRPRRELGQTVEGLEMRLGEERDHRNPLAAQQPRHLREMAEARDRRPPTTGLLLAPYGRRQLTEEQLVDADGAGSLGVRGEEVELRRAGRPE